MMGKNVSHVTNLGVNMQCEDSKVALFYKYNVKMITIECIIYTTKRNYLINLCEIII